MATLDTLPPQRRAIIELLLRQGKGYDDVASMLDMPNARVRELAREALSSLAPSTARRVEDDWRDQVADYVLGQQSGPESKATRGHLKRSEPARAWVSSLLDSLDPLYADGSRPEIPEPESGAGAAPEPRRGRRGSDPEPEGGREPAASAAAASPAQAPGARSDGSGELSPEARAHVRRRRLIAGGVAAGVVAIVLAIVLIGGGDEGSDRASRPAARPNGQQAQLVGQAQLERVGGGDNAEGVAVIARRGGEFQLLVQARGLEPSGRGAAYEVWLYNSQRQAISLGGQVTDNDGNLQGAGPLPPNFRTYRFVDISRERIDRNSGHSGTSVLRIPMAQLLRSRPPPAGAGGPATP